MRSVDAHLSDLTQQIEAMKERLDHLSARGTSREQEEILIHFLERDHELGAAALLAGRDRLRSALFVLMRVICEDLFLAHWISRSEENATRYANEVRSEVARLAMVNLDRDRAKIVERKTGKEADKNQVDEVGSKIKETVTSKKERLKTENIAKDSGLGKVYDTVYRLASLDVHGKILKIVSPLDDEAAIGAALPGMVSLLRAVVAVVDNRLHGRGTTAKEILRILNVENIAGA